MEDNLTQRDPRCLSTEMSTTVKQERCRKTEDRLHQVSAKLQQLRHKDASARKVHTREGGGRTGTPFPGQLPKYPENPLQNPLQHPQNPLQHPRISNLRRGSLTGSLPDLSEATEEDVTLGLQLALPHRPPLPGGSETFSRALAAVEAPGKEVGPGEGPFREAAGRGGIHRFRSKTAEVIHLSRFGRSFPGYMERLSREHPASVTAGREGREHPVCGEREGEQEEGHLPNINSEQSPLVATPRGQGSPPILLGGSQDNLTSHQSKHVSWGEVGVSTYVKGSIVHRSVPSSPRIARRPEVKSRSGKVTQSCDASRDPSSGDNSGGNSPILRTRSLRTSGQQLPVMRTGSPAASPRILKRRQITRNTFSRTFSVD